MVFQSSFVYIKSFKLVAKLTSNYIEKEKQI